MTEKWKRVTVVMPESAYLVYQAARRQVAGELEGLNENEAVGHGQVVELLAADYLAGLVGSRVEPGVGKLKEFPGNWA